jgi:hypothetical protein
MGGAESLRTGLNNLDKFAWIGAFSSGGLPDDFDKDFPGLDAKANQQLRLLWIACGTEDRLITVNRDSGNAYMDGLAEDSGGVRRAAVQKRWLVET